jgi:hypothetical protein
VRNAPTFSPEEIAAYEEEARAAIDASRKRMREAEVRREEKAAAAVPKIGPIPVRVVADTRTLNE